jgi:hypothetical protein
MDSTTSFYDIKAEMREYFDSLLVITDSSDFFREGSEYSQYKQFESIWESRVYLDGLFSTYFEEVNNYYSFTDNYAYVTEDKWNELGPTKVQNSTLKGIGPVEFISFFDNGTSSSTQHKLTGSLSGGLFYSDDNGNNWQPGGSDTWISSGCAWAVFHPSNNNIWYAASSSWVQNGGIYRTKNSGSEWELIADKTDLSSWTIVYKLVADPFDEKVLYAATSKGIYKTEDCDEDDPDDIGWTNILNGFIYDLEIKPSFVSASTLYCSNFDDNDNWKIHISTNSGSTWNEMSSQPAILHDPDFSLIDMHLTIEVSKAKPDYLYCAVRDGDPISFYYYDFSIGSSWNFIGSHTESKDYRFGTGHGFGVEQALNGNEIIVSKSTRLRKYYLDGTSSVNLIQIHADVEDVVYHPYNSDEVWVCSHGGTEVTTDAGNFWSPRYDGLGVAEVERLATSYTNPELILVGLYHDGVQLTESDYSSNWNPDWIWISGLGVDGMLPIIDNKNPIHMWGSGQKGLWRYSDDGFSSSEKVSDMGSAFWTTVGVVNKENPSMFFRNKFIFSTEDKEEVYRCPDRGLDDDPTIVNEFISNFNPLYPSSGLINILGMCTPYSNGDYLVLYLFEAVDEDSPRTWHVFRSTNVNEEDANLVDWVELDIPRNTDIWLSAIEFDPQNPDILYIAYKKSSDPNQSEGLIYRIDYTDINDPDIDDITDNLPITTASQDCLAAENGFNNGIYLSTEYGVFYTNDDLFINNEYEWKLVGKDLPHASSRGLEINYVSNTLRNATWGRGVWEIPLPCIRSDNPLIISSNTTWNSYIRLDRDIIIDPGVTLTIESGARVCMPTDSKIIVPRGAKLIVDGGTVTNGCSGFWKGIEVWGSSDEHQFADVNGDYEQGYLELKNGATIENAYNAVTLWKPDDWNSMGGIIIASDALFKNNRRSVEFMSYQNTDPSTGEPVGNVSSFTECEFTVDDDYFATSEFAYHISMWEVDGIKIRGCDFNNDMTTVAQRGYGIYTMDAGYKVNSYCETPISPCPENDVINTTFDGFYAGISALQAGSIYPVYVDDAIFDANGFGVKLSESDYATIINNEFYVADNDVDAGTCEMVFGIGVELLNCNGYAVEQNKFFESPTISGSSFGVLVNYEELYADEHGVEQNEIYNNEYNGLTVGNEAVGINRALDDLNWGLKFLCNQNQNNTYDFYIKDKGIQVLQGSLSEAAGNTFSQNGNNPYSDYNNQANWNILYFYDENQSDEEPLYYNEKVNPRPTENGNNCLSNYGDDDNAQTKGLGLTAAGKATYEQQYTDNLSSYNGTMALYEALKDGGDTEGVVIDIETSWPDEMLELRADLLERSPHLSKEVLYATADNTDVFPDAVIFEILAANPDEMGDEEFLAYLEEKENPLPDYYIDILRGLAGDISYKTILRCQLSDYKRKMVQAVNIIIRNEINDSLYSIDTVRNWLEVQGTLPSQFQLIDSYLQEGNTNSALTVLNSIPSMFDMSQDDSTEYNRYVSLKQLQINLLNQGRNIFLMDSTEKSLLVSISDSSKGVAGIQARNILEFVYGEHYCNCPQLPDSVTHKSYQQPANLINSTDLIELKVFPNPAKSWTVFEYKLPYNDNNVTISIYNTSGQLEHVIHIADIQGQKIWDVRDTKAGMYYYKLQVGDQVKTGSLVITK